MGRLLPFATDLPRFIHQAPPRGSISRAIRLTLWKEPDHLATAWGPRRRSAMNTEGPAVLLAGGDHVEGLRPAPAMRRILQAVGEHGDDLVLVVAETSPALFLDKAAQRIQQRGRAAGPILLRGQVGNLPDGSGIVDVVDSMERAA